MNSSFSKQAISCLQMSKGPIETEELIFVICPENSSCCSVDRDDKRRSTVHMVIESTGFMVSMFDIGIPAGVCVYPVYPLCGVGVV